MLCNTESFPSDHADIDFKNVFLPHSCYIIPESFIFDHADINFKKHIIP